MRLFYSIWFLAIIGVAMMSMTHKNESASFYGITETREIYVNHDTAIEIRKIHVIPGQEVRHGDLLVEFDRPELDIKINAIYHQLEALKTRKQVNDNEVRSLISELKARKALKISELSSQIRQLQAQYNLNRRLTSELRSINVGKKRNSGNPTLVKIANLKKEIELSVHPLQVKIDLFERELNSPDTTLNVETESLEKELSLLNEEKKRLSIFAQVSGIIGSVNFKEGEKVSPFEPVLTLHTGHPSYVKGFIHEDVYNKVAVGNPVRVVSLADSRKHVTGEVISAGTRIVEYPVRLRKRPDIQIWGREVLIKISGENQFLLGEKVRLSTPEKEGANFFEMSGLFFPEKTYAGKPDRTHPDPADRLTDIEVSASLGNGTSPEASGVLYLSDLRKYLVISDDTEDKKPVLHLMNSQGQIEENVVIEGLKKVNDMEAIAPGRAGDIYIACSQSYNKKGRIPKSRKLLLKIRRNGTAFRLNKKIRLYDLLRDAAAEYRDALWSQSLLRENKAPDIDIEGIFYRNGDIYLGFKAPFKENRAMVLRIRDIDAVMDENRLDGRDVSLWKTFDLKDHGGGVPSRLSDLCLRNDQLFILSGALHEKDGVQKKSGNLWRYDLDEETLAFVKYTEGFICEGITWNPDEGEFLMVFDCGGEQPSKIMKLKE
ncbi:hypothetical protein DENIS_0136 [Desulfonema ishimotonii]|uniref:DUF3616 domain-containing protein n=1 Tax=Desulfonema ishimotonii TaxID=45657 RepID=A0A401FQG8_9BACT|nr:DUF3616 domain-containing protein [Desulfonema ishimotonii]GBC59200.1 hypothetical protein DENIS_0136 [Desulfonema ishimotonii]